MSERARETLDLKVRLGRQAQLEARLIAKPEPEEVVRKRQQRLRKEAVEAGEKVSQMRLALCQWTIYVTTIPEELLSSEEAEVLGDARWQIELLFKLWKSHGQIDLLRDVQPWRVLCELYGRLLNQIVQHWLVLVSCWEEPARSMVKAAKTIRMHWFCLASAIRVRQRLLEALERLVNAIRAGCRMNRRKKEPNTYQRFQALDACS